MTAHSSSPERRKYVRIDCLITGKIVSVDLVHCKKVHHSAGLTKNVSAGGLLFKDVHKYNMGELVLVQIDAGALDELDNNSARVIKTRGYVLGKIARIETLEAGKFYDYGVCFVKADEAADEYFSLFQGLLNHIEFEEL